MLIQGVEQGATYASLHRVFLKSDCVSGSITVGTQTSLPVEAVGLSPM